MKEWTTESRSIESNIPAIPYGTRDCAIENSQRYTSPNTVQLTLPSLDLPDSENLPENREESQIAEPLCTDGATLDEPDAVRNGQLVSPTYYLLFRMYSGFGSTSRLLLELCRQVRIFIRRCF